MTEKSCDRNLGNDQHEETLPGVGPQLGMERLNPSGTHGKGALKLTQNEQTALDVIRAQADRYDWFAERVEVERPVEELAVVLFRPRSAPGMWEEALVALSLSYDPTAPTLLTEWLPPEDDPEMCLFHQICVSRARRRPVSPA
jgi:hypothetical protein